MLRLTTLLCPTPADHLVDAAGRPYFLWDTDMTLHRFQQLLQSSDREVRAWLVGKLMRQAKPDDVFTFVSVDEIAHLWPDLQRHLGRTLPFWTWLLGVWGVVVA
jgi:hypothetical protein